VNNELAERSCMRLWHVLKILGISIDGLSIMTQTSARAGSCLICDSNRRSLECKLEVLSVNSPGTVINMY
jgi:hypothetical protein